MNNLAHSQLVDLAIEIDITKLTDKNSSVSVFHFIGRSMEISIDGLDVYA